jgi:hypothetical protein
VESVRGSGGVRVWMENGGGVTEGKGEGDGGPQAGRMQAGRTHVGEGQIHERAEKVGTGFCLHFVLFSSREVPPQRATGNSTSKWRRPPVPPDSEGWRRLR